MNAATALLDFLLPPRCPVCSRKISDHGHLCPTCWSELSPLSAASCRQCSLPFEFEAEEGDICGTCMSESPLFDWAAASVLYEGLGRDLVIRLKYNKATQLVPVMAQMMANTVANRPCDLILPVPLHSSRLLRRRFNQSGALAAALSTTLDVPVDMFSLTKIRATASQGGLGRQARFSNVATSFSASSGKDAALEGLDILLVDDVLTTGATASACAKALKRAGARTVGIGAFARVGKPIAG